MRTWGVHICTIPGYRARCDHGHVTVADAPLVRGCMKPCLHTTHYSFPGQSPPQVTGDPSWWGKGEGEGLCKLPSPPLYIKPHTKLAYTKFFICSTEWLAENSALVRGGLKLSSSSLYIPCTHYLFFWVVSATAGWELSLGSSVNTSWLLLIFSAWEHTIPSRLIDWLIHTL